MPWPILPIDKEQRLDGITPGIETTAPRTQQAKRAKEERMLTGGGLMQAQNPHPQHAHGLSRRTLLQAGLAAGATLSAWPFSSPPALWSAEAGPPKRGGILRVRGRDPVHFDPHLTRDGRTHTVLSFVYSKLLRHKVGGDVQPGTFSVEPDLAERWGVVA